MDIYVGAAFGLLILWGFAKLSKTCLHIKTPGDTFCVRCGKELEP